VNDGGDGTFACQKNEYGCLNYLSSFNSVKKKKKKKNDVEILSLRDGCTMYGFCISALNTFFLTMVKEFFGLTFQHVASSSYMMPIEEWN
jgi:hypothetical protein